MQCVQKKTGMPTKNMDVKIFLKSLLDSFALLFESESGKLYSVIFLHFYTKLRLISSPGILSRHLSISIYDYVYLAIYLSICITVYLSI